MHEKKKKDSLTAALKSQYAKKTFFYIRLLKQYFWKVKAVFIKNKTKKTSCKHGGGSVMLWSWRHGEKKKCLCFFYMYANFWF